MSCVLFFLLVRWSRILFHVTSSMPSTGSAFVPHVRYSSGNVFIQFGSLVRDIFVVYCLVQMLKKDGRNLLVNTKIRSIHFVNIVLLCECTLCMVNVFFILLFVCMFVFSFCALPYWWIKMYIYIDPSTVGGQRNPLARTKLPRS